MQSHHAFVGLGCPAPFEQADHNRADPNCGGWQVDSCVPTLVTRAAAHEFYAARHADAVAMSACALALAHTLAEGRSLLWVRHSALKVEAGSACASGAVELGLDPARLVLVRVKDITAALQAGLEGARCAGLGAVIMEFQGEAKAYDLTASRRLALAAKTSGTPVFITRSAAQPQPSAAETRWLMRAAQSRVLAANAPGHPAFALTLLRARNGQDGQHHHLEWNRNVRQFVSLDRGRANPILRPDRAAALSGRVVPVSFDRSTVPVDGQNEYPQAEYREAG